MNKYIKTDKWSIIENEFHPERVRAGESLFSIGNGHMGGRANFEEHFSGDTLPGNYIGGVYYPDKTRVGWWKNGYPEYFAKVPNSAFWPGVDVVVAGERIDLATCRVVDYHRRLDMHEGTLSRRVSLVTPGGRRVTIEALRFVSMRRPELGVVRYSVTLPDSDAEVTVRSYIAADVRNEDANYDEKFWTPVSQTPLSITMRTLKSDFTVSWAMENRLDGALFTDTGTDLTPAQSASVSVAAGRSITLYKFVGIASSLNHPADQLPSASARVACEAADAGFDTLLREQKEEWAALWDKADIIIDGDDDAQQGIRYCIFQLLQTYTGRDSRLNVGPKGFTGEKYGGSTYWDTEAYCLPFYMAVAGEEVARNLLIYRYNQLDEAIANAEMLGFKDGAALYPMVTMNGKECHNEWEITFEEIHRNGAIAYAIFNYVRYTGNRDYLATHGLEVLISIARFWAQRVNFSAEKGQYVMLGVTGPNEYENNVNNNWYTLYIARWCMRYAAETALWVRDSHPDDYRRIVTKRHFDHAAETARWNEICESLYLPYDSERDIFLQQDGYMDKEQILVKDLPVSERPINQKWSWDRILRSCFIKQADVLQGLYFFRGHFDTATIERNFRFYEARTVHESSLSPCVHAILAAAIGDIDKAEEMYLRTARLDLDDYNNENREGLHITSMAGSWLAVVEGFGGMRVENDRLTFTPRLPKSWRSVTFKLRFRGKSVIVKAHADGSVTVD
ncbi:MAG: glycoside hydrolase family 65 protein [Rikenellaceae bacterium]|nr:glycoside hydrolase family 65 protein [Rikenellaceae bacterium]